MTSHTPENCGGGKVRVGRGRTSARASALTAAALGLGGLSAGCQHQSAVVKEPPDPRVIVDPAMLRRDWEPAKAQWANAQLVGWPMRFPFDRDVTTDRPFPNSRSIDTILFLLQTVELPFTYIAQPPFQRTLYTSGVQYDPTFTAMPALPPPVSGGQAGQNGQQGNTQGNGQDNGAGTGSQNGAPTGVQNGQGTQGNNGATGNPNAPGTVTPGAAAARHRHPRHAQPRPRPAGQRRPRRQHARLRRPRRHHARRRRHPQQPRRPRLPRQPRRHRRPRRQQLRHQHPQQHRRHPRRRHRRRHRHRLPRRHRHGFPRRDGDRNRHRNGNARRRRHGRRRRRALTFRTPSSLKTQGGRVGLPTRNR